jgi:hypothetical protein
MPVDASREATVAGPEEPGDRLVIEGTVYDADVQAPTSSTSAPVRLDGYLDEAAWDGAERHELRGGGEVLLLRAGEAVYVAVQSDAFGWSHVYLLAGDTLRVLHASAALGTAEYVHASGDEWRRAQNFEWVLRDTTFTPAARAARRAFYDDHGWIANTNMMGTGRVIEFRLDASLLASEAPKLAVLHASDPAEPHYWPATVQDATLDATLISGRAPEQLTFEPSSWSTLSAESK